MTDFVRICPKCQHINPEYENLCAQCQQFIGMEPSTAPPAKHKQTSNAAVSHHIRTASMASSSDQPTEKSFCLRTAENRFIIHHDAVIGQVHPDNRSAVQIPDNIEGSAYVHRQHCSFHYRQGQWYVRVIDQHMFGQLFTNPSWLNESRLAVNEEHRLNHGDVLRLAAVTLTVEIDSKTTS